MKRLMKLYFVLLLSLVLAVCFGGTVFAKGYVADGWTVFYDGSAEKVDLRGIYHSYTEPVEVIIGQVKGQGGSGDYSAWNAQVVLTVDAGKHDRIDYPVEVQVDLTALLKKAGVNGNLDRDSLRLVNSQTGGESPVQYTKDNLLVFVVEGELKAGSTRDYCLYFDKQGSGTKPSVKAVSPLEYVKDEENPRIVSEDLVLFLHTSRFVSGMSIPSIDSENWLFGGDMVWTDIDNQWWSPFDNDSEFEILEEGPVRIRAKVTVDVLIRQIRVEKTYTLYYTGRQFHFITDWTTSKVPPTTLDSHKIWSVEEGKFAYYDGSQIVYTSVPAPNTTFYPAEPWFAWYSDKVTALVVMGKDYLPNTFFVNDNTVFGPSRGELPPVFNK